MLPLEPFTALIGIGIGAWKDLRQQQNENLKVAILGHEAYEKSLQNARKMGGQGIQWTKRTLALLMVGTYCTLHLGINVGEVFGLTSQVVIGYTEIVPKFLWFGEKEAFKWVSVEGVALTAAFSNMVALVLGYYFGSNGTIKK